MIGRLFAGLLLALIASAAQASQVAVTSSAWVDLGPAPISVMPIQGGDVYLLQAASAPSSLSTTGASLIGPYTTDASNTQTFQGTNHVYALQPAGRAYPVFVDVEIATGPPSTVGLTGSLPDTAAGDLHATQTGVAQLHTDNGSSGSPPSGSGVMGWLANVYSALTGNLNVKINTGPGSSAAAPLPVASANPGALYNVPATLATTAAALPGQALVNGVVCYPGAANAGTNYWGGVGLTASNGVPMIAGKPFAPPGITNANEVYILGTNTSDTVRCVGN